MKRGMDINDYSNLFWEIQGFGSFFGGVINLEIHVGIITLSCKDRSEKELVYAFYVSGLDVGVKRSERTAWKQ